MDRSERQEAAALRRLVEVVLIVAIAIGGFLAWRTGHERDRLERSYDRLSRKAGELEIGDPTRVHFRAIQTGEPLHFAWRVYLPASYPARVHLRAGQSVGHDSVSRSQPQEFIARVRFREDENGILHVFSKFAGGSNRVGVGDQAFAKLLHGRWNEVLAEQLGADGMAAIDPDKLVTLLRLRLPPEIEGEAKTALAPEQQNGLVPVFLELQLGSPASKPNP
jgi:hypothetical protein